MKKKILAALATGLILSGTVGMAQAYSIDGGVTDIGNVDTFLTSADLNNSGDSTELAWINNYLGTNYQLSAFTKYDTTNGSGWEATVEDANIYAHALQSAPEYFFIKTGNLTTTNDDHFLFNNVASLDYAVINLAALGITSNDIVNVEKISHIGEVGGNSVPEPAPLLLLGTGLVGLAGVARKRGIKKN